MAALSHPRWWTSEDFDTVEITLRNRLTSDLDYFGYDFPEDRVVLWKGYLTGLREWGLISLDIYTRLVSLLPKTDKLLNT